MLLFPFHRNGDILKETFSSLPLALRLWKQRYPKKQEFPLEFHAERRRRPKPGASQRMMFPGKRFHTV